VQVSVRVLFSEVSRLSVKNNWQTLTVTAASSEQSEILMFSADFLFLLVANKILTGSWSGTDEHYSLIDYGKVLPCI